MNLICKIKILEKWIANSKYKGWDPYDIQDSKFYKKSLIRFDNFLISIFYKLFYIFTTFFPLISRRILFLKKKTIPKGLGLILKGYVNLYKIENNNEYLDKAIYISEKLISLSNKNYSGFCWGYPFDWHTKVFIPKNTPSSVVSSVIGDGFYSLYEETSDFKYLEVCIEICDFFISNLNKTINTNNELCFSYTPLDDFQVINSNLFVGEFISRIGKLIDNKDWVSIGIKVGNYTLKQQHENGYLPYWSIEQTNTYSNGKIHIDHYHTGFEIRLLYKLGINTGNNNFTNSAIKYYHWYLKNLYSPDGIIKLTPSSLYPIDIHSCAEAIIVRSSLLDIFPDDEKNVKELIYWIIEKMNYSNGKYIYRIINNRHLGDYKIKIPMFRWGQGWMFLALSEYIVKQKQIKNENRNDTG